MSGWRLRGGLTTDPRPHREKMKIILQMAIIMTWGGKKRVVKLARIADSIPSRGVVIARH